MLLIQNPHQLETHEIAGQLATQVDQGLASGEVSIRRGEFGENAISTGKRESKWLIFFRQFHNPLVYILLLAVLVTLFLHEYLDAGVIFGVVIINAIVGYLQEVKAVKALDSLAQTMETMAVVIREGSRLEIPSRELVPGDIVFLQSGDKVPADIRLFKTNQLRVQEAALTGESMAVEKIEQVLPAETPLADRRNMLYASTFVAYGQGYGITVYTGDATEIGKISNLMKNTSSIETPLLRKIAAFSHVLVVVIGAMAVLTFGIGLYRGEPWFEMMKAAIALAVGAIPEGLPAALTATLAIGVNRMARRNSIIRKLPVVETLGGTTVICSDKTGTLTENQMTVTRLWTMAGLFQVSGQGYLPAGDLFTEQAETLNKGQLPPAVAMLLKAGVLCNDSRWAFKDQEVQLQGDPTEISLHVVAAKAGLSVDDLQRQNPREAELPFESDRQYMATKHRQASGDGFVFIKGAVEKVLALCDGALAADGSSTSLVREELLKQYEAMAAQGLRVLAFAVHNGEIPALDDLPDKFTFIGFQGMIDPPRQEAIAAIKTCQQAGIVVKMITGDHGVTAGAIAQQIGIAAQGDSSRVYTGTMLAELAPDELQYVAKSHNVFARVTPEQKLRLVEALQAEGNVVAMTGDGVNDAPALKKADIGIAMGITGTEVAKDAADMVLADDNFASIEAAVEEGRGVFDNLVKFITWTLPTNIGEGMVIMLAIFLGVTLPITPLQILWINMTTAVCLGLMLAFEPKEPGIMTRRPRRPDAPLLNAYLMFKIILVGMILLLVSFGLFNMELEAGRSIEEARTVAVTVFIVVEAAYLLNCRSLTKPLFSIGFFSNPFIWLGIAIMGMLQLAFIYLPWMNLAFATRPIGFDVWWKILLAGACVIPFIELEKWLVDNYFQHQAEAIDHPVNNKNGCG